VAGIAHGKARQLLSPLVADDEAVDRVDQPALRWGKEERDQRPSQGGTTHTHHAHTTHLLLLQRSGRTQDAVVDGRQACGRQAKERGRRQGERSGGRE
jgi:hypothetical protein